MDINQLISEIKADIGLLGVMAGIYDDAVIKDSIMNRSLPEFNRWSGFIINFKLDGLLNHWKHQYLAENGVDLIVVMPDELINDLQNLGCEIKRAYCRRIPQYPTSGYFYSTGMKDDMLFYQMNEHLRINQSNPSWEFRAPNTLIGRDYGRYSYRTYTAWQLHCECTHPRNLSTITPGLEASFLELCKLDIMINMWNSELRFLNADVGNAQIGADVLENFRNAEQDRRDLIEKLRKKNAIDHIDFVF